MTSDSKFQGTLQSRTPRPITRNIAMSVFALSIFVLLFSIGVASSRQIPHLGLSGEWLTSEQTWRITSVGPLGPAGDADARPGDLVRRVNGETPVQAHSHGDTQLGSANSIELIRPSTGEIVTVEADTRSLNWNAILAFSLVFFVVGFAALSHAGNPSSRALALVSLTAAAELTVLPGAYLQAGWAMPLHSLLIPLFATSFAYLFLTFPVQRRIKLSRVKIPSWIFPASSIPFAAISYYCSSIRPELYLTFRVFGAPYLLLCLFIGVGSLVLTWRGTVDPRVRTQTRLVVYGSLLSILPFLFLSVLPEAVAMRDILLPKYSVLSLVLMPLAFGYAILRYQIMDLQLYVRRGIVYAILALLVTGVYAATLFIATTVVQHQLGLGNGVVLAISGAIVAIVFNRLREELQSLVDRIFDRSHYDYRSQLLEFSQRMAEHLDDDRLGQTTAALISQTLEPTYVRFYLFDDQQELYRLRASTGDCVPDGLAEINSRHPIVSGLDADGGLRARIDADRDETALAILLKKERDIVGLLALGPKKAGVPYSSEDVALLRTVANQLAVAADNSRLYERTRDLYLASIKTLAATVDAKDPYTHGHSNRVASYAREIAKRMNLDDDQVVAIHLAGLLHDIGKIGIPDSILQKPGRLDPDERALIIEHAALGAKIISENPSLIPLAPLVRHHHEWFNGGGYPDGLEGTDIPLGAAIISVADTYDTMTTDRPYRAAPGREKAIAELKRCSGSQFHPGVVAMFLSMQETDETSEMTAVPTYQPYLVAGRISTVDTRAMRIIYRVVQTIGEVTDLSGFITRVVDLIQREIGTGTVDIYLKDVDSHELISTTPATEETGIKELRIEPGAGLAGWVAEHRVPARVEDTQHDAWGNRGRHPRTRSHLAVPLLIDGETIGVIDVQSPRTGSFTSDDETLLVIVAQQLAQVVEVAQLHDQLKKSAVLDGLTGVANHRHFYQRLEAELAGAIRNEYDVSVMLIDVDGLKLINDTHGHIAGDAALKALAALLERESRSTDIVARYGGDEFAVILPGVDEGGALQYAARIERTIIDSTFQLHGSSIPLPSISWGISSRGRDGDRAVTLVSEADSRMYRNKFSAPRSERDSMNASSNATSA